MIDKIMSKFWFLKNNWKRKILVYRNIMINKFIKIIYHTVFVVLPVNAEEIKVVLLN